MSLLPRFYNQLQGRILLEGHESSRYRLRTLREQIVIMRQDVIVLAGSVPDNLRYGQLDASDAAIEEAARAAHAHDFIMRLPHGYDTQLAEAGQGLQAASGSDSVSPERF